MPGQDGFEAFGLALGFGVVLLQLRLHLGVVLDALDLALGQLDGGHFEGVHVAQAGVVDFVRLVGSGVAVH